MSPIRGALPRVVWRRTPVIGAGDGSSDLVLSPTFVLVNEYNGRLKVVKMNVDDNPKTPAQFGVRGIPNLILFKGGEVKEQIIGAVPKGTLVKAVDNAIAA